MEIAGSTVAEIFDSIRREVHAGRLAAGLVLPSVRELAARLGVNRNTVAAAYKRLVAAGLADTLGRNGTVIRPVASPVEQEGGLAGSPLADLASGNPDPAWLPDPLQALAGSGYRATLYGEPVIDGRLEELARRWLEPDCANPFQVTLAHGAVDAIERLCAAHLVPGDLVAVEDPCFLGSLNALRCGGLEAVPVAMDAHGMLPDSLQAALARGVQAVLYTPRAQNPTGCGFSEARAIELRRVLANHPHVLLVEDDHYALLAQMPYFSLVPAGAPRWAMVRSVSKGLGPDVRLAVVASDGGTAARLATRQTPGTTWVSHLLQAVVCESLSSPAIRARLAAASESYALRRNTLVGELRAEGIEALQPCDGLNVWVPLPVSPGVIAHALARHGWLVRAGDVFAIDAEAAALRVTISQLSAADARRFAVQLGQCLRQVGGAVGSCSP